MLLMEHLGLKEGDEFIFVNRYYRSDNSGKVAIKVDDTKVVEMKEK